MRRRNDILRLIILDFVSRKEGRGNREKRTNNSGKSLSAKGLDMALTRSSPSPTSNRLAIVDHMRDRNKSPCSEARREAESVAPRIGAFNEHIVRPGETMVRC
jgi:hypothetical protein